MGSECQSKNGCGDGFPAAAKKVVQSLKEIVDCTEQEIYAVLEECDMDPNLAVERLLAQDKFHEVRSKRERRKEMKETLDSRAGNCMGLGRGGRISTGSEHGVEHRGLAKLTYNEHGKDIDKRGVGSVYASVMPPPTHVGTNSKNVPFSCDDGHHSLKRGDSKLDTSQVSTGSQPMLIGMSKGHLSMADIVRMDITSQDAVSNDHFNSSVVSSSGNLESSWSLHSENNTKQHVHDKGPVIEQPCIGNAQTPSMSALSNANGLLEDPNIHVTAVNLNRNHELDRTEVSRWEIATDSATSEIIESASISNKHNIMSRNTGLGSHSNLNLKTTCIAQFGTSCKNHEDVSAVARDLQHVSMRESKVEVPSVEANSAVVLPNHVHALGAECSHLSFGTYKGGKSSASSKILASNHSRSGLEKPAAVDNSLSLFPDTSSVNHDAEQLRCGGLGGISGDPNYDFLSSPWSELVKNIISQDTLGNEYSTTADPSLPKSHWVTTSRPLKKSGLQSGSHSTIPRELPNNSNSKPHDVLAFLRSQSQRGVYINAESSISNYAIPVSEVKEPGTFALHNRSTPTQDFMPQSKIHFQQYPDMEGYYHTLPQNQSYMTTIDPQQVFLESTSYNRSHADMNYNLPQSRNEFLLGRLTPATASSASGHGNFGSSFSNPESFLSNPLLGNMRSSSNFNEILPSEYIRGLNLSSTQPNGRFSQRGYGTESKSSFLPQRTFMGQPSQASLSQYVSPGYSDYHHSQAPVSEELGQSGGFHYGSPEELRQIWQRRN